MSESERRGRDMGVTGPLQYDLDVQCFADDHEDGVFCHPTEEVSDKNNPILECPECGYRVAVDTHVVPVTRSEPTGEDGGDC